MDLEKRRSGDWIERLARRSLDKEGIDSVECDYESDLVPWELVKCIITEEGIKGPEDIRGDLASPAPPGPPVGGPRRGAPSHRDQLE